MLAGCLVVMQLALIAVWSNRRTRSARRIMLAGLALCILLPAIQHLVVTDRERIEGVCHRLVRLTESGNVDGIAACIDPDFETDGVSRARFVDAVRHTLTRVQILDASLHNVRIETTADAAEARFSVTCKVVGESQMHYGVLSAWTVRLVRDGQTWRVIGLTPRETPVFPYHRLSQIIR